MLGVTWRQVWAGHGDAEALNLHDIHGAGPRLLMACMPGAGWLERNALAQVDTPKFVAGYAAPHLGDVALELAGVVSGRGLTGEAHRCAVGRHRQRIAAVAPPPGLSSRRLCTHARTHQGIVSLAITTLRLSMWSDKRP